MVRKFPIETPSRIFTEEIDDAECVRQHNFFHLPTRMLCLCLALTNVLLSVAPLSSSFVTMTVSIPHSVVNSDSLSQDADCLREGYDYEALAFSRHIVDLEFEKETMKPEKAIEAPRNAGIEMKRPTQGHVSDQKAPTGTERATHQARERIEDDDERLALRKGDMPPPVPERVANPKSREDRTVEDFRQNSEKMHRATSEYAHTKAWFDNP